MVICIESVDLDKNTVKIYYYDEYLQGLIYQFKGCFDIELKNIFLERYVRELNLFYKGYYVLPAPSFEEDNLKRGFNHVKEIFGSLKLPMLDILVKTEKFKQADHNYVERKNIAKYLALKEKEILKNKNILIVDDIYTTGSTIRSIISLLKDSGVKKIKILVICKTKLK